MTELTNSGLFLRRGHDFPVLLLSMDYELFFRRSGSIEKCLFEPTAMLLDFANASGVRLTFYIDAGMLCRLAELAPAHMYLQKQLSQVRTDVAKIAAAGHEIGLHIHPHWEDTRYVRDEWDFSNTRYKLDDFSDSEIRDIVSRYTAELNDLCDGGVSSYRAGGFCIEPFKRLGGALQEQGIAVDSSVVPGLRIRDPEKGVDFRQAPEGGWWFFDKSPSIPETEGEFIEIPVTGQVLPAWHYWRRALARAVGQRPATVAGDGTPKAIGREEIIRRLTGRGRTSELSVDAPKAGRLNAADISRTNRRIWHVMGHPKLLGQSSLDALQKFIDRKEIQRFETVAGFADIIRARASTSAAI